MKFVIVTILFYNFILINNLFAENINMNTLQTDPDSVFLCVDSSGYNLHDNIIKCNVIFKKQTKTFLVYSYQNQDNNVEFDYLGSYKNKNSNYKIYQIVDLSTGIEWDIIYNRATNKFYITNPFNLKATDDCVIKESVDFIHRNVMVKRGDSVKTYSINLKLIKLKELTKGKCSS